MPTALIRLIDSLSLRHRAPIVFLALLILSGGCNPGTNNTKPGVNNLPSSKATGQGSRRGRNRGPEATVRAEVYEVVPLVWPATVRIQGSLVSDEQTMIGAKVSGRLYQVYVDVGDVVRKGDPMVQLDQQDFQLLVVQAEAQLLQARAALGMSPSDSLETLDPKNSPPVREAFAIWSDAQATVKRMVDLQKEKVVSEAEFDQALANERVTKARYDTTINSANEKIALIRVRMADLGIARQRLDDTIVVAPIDGTVQSRIVSPGTFIQAGQGLISIVRTTTLRFRGSIPERYVRQLKIDQSVELDIESTDNSRPSKISRISPTLDMQSRSLMFESLVENNDNQLRAGLFAEGKVILNPNAEVIAVPRSATVRFAGVEKVWKVVNGKVVEQPIRVGRDDKDRIEVLDGLVAGDEILMNGREGRAGKFERITQGSPNPQDSSNSGEKVDSAGQQEDNAKPEG